MRHNPLYTTIEHYAKQTGCEVQTNAAGNPMFTMTTTELIKFLVDVQEDAILAALLNKHFGVGE